MRLSFLFSGVLLFSSISNAAFDIHLAPDEKARLGEQAHAIENLIQQTQNSLPEKLKSKINGSISIRLDLKTSTPIETFNCDTNYLNTENEVYLAKNRWDQAVKQFGPAIRLNGSTVESQIPLKDGKLQPEIRVNSEFIELLKASNPVSFACEHRNVRELFKANIINALGRMYSYRTRETESPKYLLLNEFVKATSKDKQTGTKTIRKYFPREFHPYANLSDVHTHFGYALEFFLLDPEFKCRRPTLYDQMAEMLGAKPQLNSSCQVNTKVTMVSAAPTLIKGNTDCPIAKINGECPVKDRYASYYQVFDLNPNNVYGLQYVKSAPGQGLASKFGHAAFRVQVCPDFQLHKDPSKCARRTINGVSGRRWANDLIFNYRANTMGLQINNFRGLKGIYPTQLFLTSVGEYMNEYGNDELRNVYAFPIEFKELAEQTSLEFSQADKDSMNISTFDSQKIRTFVNFGLERFWTYIGNYNFLSRNCADEAFEHVKIALDDQKLYGMGVLTPTGVEKKLAKKDFLDRDVIDQKALQTKMKSWDEFDKALKEANGNEFVFTSNKYSIVSSMRFVMENLGLPTTSPDDVLKELKEWEEAFDFKLPKKAPRFVTLAETIRAEWMNAPGFETLRCDPNSSEQDVTIKCHMDEVAAVREKLKNNPEDSEALGLYLAYAHVTLMHKMFLDFANTEADRKLITQSFYKLYKHVHRMVDRELNKRTMQLSCKIINCDRVEDRARGNLNIEDVFSKPIEMLSLADAKAIAQDPAKLAEKLDYNAYEFYQVQEAKRPFRKYTTKSGYGIPLESEVISDQRLKNLNYVQTVYISNIYRLLSDATGALLFYEGVLKQIRAGMYWSLCEQERGRKCESAEDAPQSLQSLE